MFFLNGILGCIQQDHAQKWKVMVSCFTFLCGFPAIKRAELYQTKRLDIPDCLIHKCHTGWYFYQSILFDCNLLLPTPLNFNIDTKTDGPSKCDPRLQQWLYILHFGSQTLPVISKVFNSSHRGENLSYPFLRPFQGAPKVTRFLTICPGCHFAGRLRLERARSHRYVSSFHHLCCILRLSLVFFSASVRTEGNRAIANGWSDESPEV